MSTSLRRGLLGAAAVNTAVWIAAAGVAIAAPEPVVGHGVSAPSGLVETPDGARWIADAVKGVCRVAADSRGLVPSAYCDADDHEGPKEAVGLAFAPGGDHLFVGDGHSHGGAIWRLHWNAATGTIDRGTSLGSLPEDRVQALALTEGPDPAVVFITTRSDAVQRIASATVAPSAPRTIGFARNDAPDAIAALGGAIYLGEGSGLTRLDLAGAGDATAERVEAAVGTAPTALAADHARGRLYLGTSHPGLTDDVLAVDVARDTLETYETGFTGVIGLGVAPDGDLLVGDDPALAAGAIDTADRGRVWRVPLAPLGRPVVTVRSAPAASTSATTVTFAYSGPADARFECRLDGAVWTACPGTGSGSVAYHAVHEGVHAFEVRGLGETGTGLPARRVFTVDRTAPSVDVAGPAGEVDGPSARMDFAGDEAVLAYTCSLDDAAFAPCEPGEHLTGLMPGEHVLRVIAEDPAGNASAPAASAFTVLAPPAPTSTPGRTPPHERGPDASPAPRAEAPQETSAPAPAPAPVPAPAAPAAPTPAGAARPASAPAALVAPRLEPFRLRPVRIVERRGRRALRLELTAPAHARVLHVSVRGGRGGRALLARDLAVRPGARNRLVLRLTPQESRRLRPGLYLVTASLEAAPGVTGNVQSHWLRVLPRR